MLNLLGRHAGTNHAVHIALQHRRRHAKPDGIDERDDVAPGERIELGANVRREFRASLVRSFRIREEGSKPMA
jgi:hypothetical protein